MAHSDDQVVQNSNGTEADVDMIGENVDDIGGAGTSSNDAFEDGHDLMTHGGGSVESVEGFDYSGPLTEGIGTTETYALPTGWETLKPACSVHYGDVQESVCGADDRTQVTGVSSVPWRMICQLIITMGDGRTSRGTGWFISPRTVMTAGHCVFSSEAGGWVESIEVIPGMNGTSRPFGSATSEQFRSVQGWTDSAKKTHDYGCIILPESARLGDRTGWFGFAKLSDPSLKNLLANNSGYPGDKSFGTQWYNAGRVSEVTPRRIHYMIDTAPGQSGSPTWRYSADTKKRHAIGIHAYGGCANKSTRINAPVYANMTAWKAQGA